MNTKERTNIIESYGDITSIVSFTGETLVVGGSGNLVFGQQPFSFRPGFDLQVEYLYLSIMDKMWKIVNDI